MFVILTPANALYFVPPETLLRPKFMIETSVAQVMTQYERCYTPIDLALGGQKIYEAKSQISEGEVEEF